MIPGYLINALAAAADIAINGVLAAGAPGQRVPTDEVGFVAAVVIGGVKALASAWSPILAPAGYAVRISGVFCHQAPLVRFIDGQGVAQCRELADLLVVVEDHTGSLAPRRWGVLVQAKMAAAGGGVTLSSAGDLAQLYLLSNWPTFNLPSGFAARPRDFASCSYPGIALNCARYGLINPQPSPAWRQQAPANPQPPGGPQLGGFLAQMVESGQTTFGREATGTADDWSFTVDELLRVTGRSIFNLRRAFPSPQPRGVTAVASSHPLSFAGLVPPGLWGWFPPSGGRPDRPDEEGESEGISVLNIGVYRSGDDRPTGGWSLG